MASGGHAGSPGCCHRRAGVSGPTDSPWSRQARRPPQDADSSPRQRGARRLNHLSLCSSQLNGSGQLKMSSHCLSAQMLAPPPPGLPRLALPPATKPTSEGGSTSPTSPCKHSGSGARGRAGVPEGPPPLPSPTAGVRGSGLPGTGEFGGSPDRSLGGHVVGPTWGQGSLREWQARARGASGVPVCPLPASEPPPCKGQVAVGQDLKLVAVGAGAAPRCLLSVEDENLLS